MNIDKWTLINAAKAKILATYNKNTSSNSKLVSGFKDAATQVYNKFLSVVPKPVNINQIKPSPQGFGLPTPTNFTNELARYLTTNTNKIRTSFNQKLIDTKDYFADTLEEAKRRNSKDYQKDLYTKAMSKGLDNSYSAKDSPQWVKDVQTWANNRPGEVDIKWKNKNANQTTLLNLLELPQQIRERATSYIPGLAIGMFYRSPEEQERIQNIKKFGSDEEKAKLMTQLSQEQAMAIAMGSTSPTENIMTPGIARDILGVGKNATKEEIMVSYKNIMKDEYPRTITDSKSMSKVNAAKIINEAKDILLDSLKVDNETKLLAWPTKKNSPGEIDRTQLTGRQLSMTNEQLLHPETIKFNEDLGMAEREFKVNKPSKAIITEVPQVIRQTSPDALQLSEARKMADIAQINAEGNLENYKSIISEWLGKNKNAQLEGYQFGKQFKKLSTEDATALIKGIESKKVPESLKTYAEEFRKLDDEVIQMANNEKLDINYLQNHVSHIWKEGQAQVEEKYLAFKRQYGLNNHRTYPTYEEGMKMGLVPKYSDPRAILGYQVQQLYKAKAGMEAFEKLKNEGVIVPASVGYKMPDFQPIKATGFPQSETVIGKGKSIIGSWYAPREIADEINKVFAPKEVNKALEVSSKISGAVQDITMSGGIPGTPINAWTFAQMQKEMLAGRFKSPIQAIFAGDKFMEAKVPVIKRMQLNDVSINTGRVVDNLQAPEGLKGKGGELWNKLINYPTFRKFAPALQINFFEDISDGLVKKGLTQEEADAVAAKAVKNFYGPPGTYAEAKANPNVRAAIQTGFFAPRYREQIINFWWNSVKGLRHPLAPENVMNTKFLAGAAILLGVMNYINKKMNGHGMKDNPSGMEDKLMIPLRSLGFDSDTVIAIPWLSSIATLPRLGIRDINYLKEGDIKSAITDTGSTVLSQLIRPGFDIARNENYFGKPIVQGNETPAKKWLKYGRYYTTSFSHPYLQELTNPQNVGDPAYQRISRALEMPIRYYTQNQIDSKFYYQNVDQITKGFNQSDQNIWSVIHPEKKDLNGNLIYEAGVLNTMQKATLYLNNPRIEQAEIMLAQLQKSQGKITDPIWDLTPSQRHLIWGSQARLPGQSNDYSKSLYDQVWYPFYEQARTKYFDTLPLTQSSGLKAPVPSERVKLLMNANQWNDGEVKAYLAQNNAYNNQRLAMVGLTPTSSQTYTNKAKKVTLKKIKLPKGVKIKKAKKIGRISTKMKKAKKISSKKSNKFTTKFRKDMGLI